MEQLYLVKDDRARYFDIKNFNPNTTDFKSMFGPMGCATPMNIKASEDLISYLASHDKNLVLSLEDIDHELALAMINDSSILQFIKKETFEKYQAYLEAKYREDVYLLYVEMDKNNIPHGNKPVAETIMDLMTLAVANLDNSDKSEDVLILVFKENKSKDDYHLIYSLLIEIGLEFRKKEI